MKKPVVDYRSFRLRRLNEPQFAHLKLLGGWIVYFIMYFLTENLIPLESCHVIHGRLDDVIPFCEYFVIPYVSWYVLIVISLGYFALYDIPSFRRLSIFIIVTQVLAMLIYIIYPNRQDLRPAEFVRDNLCTRVVGWLYAFDTNSNVCPSLHVAYSIGIASAWLKAKQVHWSWKAFVTALVCLICISVAFVKQHSVVDIYVAIPVSLAAEAIAFGSYWRDKWRSVRRA